MQAFIAIVFDCSVDIAFAYNNQEFPAVQIKEGGVDNNNHFEYPIQYLNSI
jgi:hypothetical protein